MTILSPLTEQSHVELIEEISVADITKLYEKQPSLLEVVKADFEGVKNVGLYECIETGLKFFYPCITASEEYYNQLNENNNVYYPDRKSEYSYASHFVNQEDIVLEVGAGKGAFFKYIKPKAYIGLEFSESAIEIASKEGIELKKESVEDHSSNSDNKAKYSVAVAFQVLEHVAYPAQFVQSILECLNEDGVLIISVPSEDAFYSTRVNDILNLPPHHVTRWSDRALESLAHRFNLEVIGVYHEKLGEAERGLFLYCIALLALLKSFGMRKKLVDTSFQFKVVSKIASAISKFLLKGFQEQGLMPNGHSVTVVYRKKQQHS
ncbi:class I SAM-dependent methyltransferase [Leptolyngbya sp. 7M]|uniref:class I SAM-dependent methyltransferase n=1 Tax=Leptolyngbya sp. 7M TaxID=2812896 RepID=UPI001B8C9451|nr:class I SAM-dependent methyltransferase [Leptolyngbya sp. 7M]QYO62536.1 class I SAM-dependent methyltransferase [Leptolyngbya sp. 7M]